MFLSFKQEDIYNFDETAQFYKMTPNKTYLAMGNSLSGSTLHKKRITIFLGCNLDGSDKVKPLVIGHAKTPQCFRKLSVRSKKIKTKDMTSQLSLPVDYVANSKAWMTSKIFTTYMKTLNLQMKRRKKKILLILDNFSGHPALNLSNIEFMFLPPNTTSILQPLDLGIIKNFKHYYRTQLLQDMVNAIDNKHSTTLEMDVLQAIFLVNQAWASVKLTTVKNCFFKSGLFGNNSDSEEVEEEGNVLDLWTRANEQIDFQLSLDEYMNIDQAIQELDIIDEDYLFNGISDEEETEPEDLSDDDSNSVVPVESTAQILDYLDKARKYLAGQPNVPDTLFDAVNTLQSGITMLVTANKKQIQSDITHFLVLDQSNQ